MDYCSICLTPSTRRKKITETYGFLYLHILSDDVFMRSAADLLQDLWCLIQSNNLTEFLSMYHHYNCAFYCYPMNVDVETKQFRFYSFSQSIKQTMAFIEKRGGVVPLMAILGGAGDGGKAVKKNHRRQSNQNKSKTQKQKSPKSNQQKQGLSLERFVESIEVVEKKLELPEVSATSSINEVTNEHRSDKEKAKRMPGTRRNASNNAIANSLKDSRAQEQGQRDAEREKRQEEFEQNKERERIQKEADKARAIQAFNAAAHSDFSFKARPAANFGMRYKGFSIFGRDASRVAFWTASAAVAGCFVAPFCAPALISLSRSLFKQQFEPVTYKLYHEIRTKSGAEDVSLRDSENEIVDARPSETKIGDADLNQIVKIAELTHPARVVCFEDDIYNDTTEQVTVQCEHDDVFLQRLVSFKDSSLSSAKTFAENVFALAAHWVSDKLGFRRGEDHEERIEEIHDAIRQSVNSIQSAFNHVSNQPYVAGDYFKGPNTFLTKACDGHAFVNKQGFVIPIYNTMALWVKGLFNDRTPMYYSSCTAKEFTKPTATRVAEASVYNELKSELPFCAHSYHNACTYGANSSQVSAETNFAMIYRKMSRYTAVNQNRFDDKTLLTNAEQLARLHFWSVREKPIEVASRLHF